MSYRILTKNSVDNTNIDGARQNHFNAGMRSGIVKGALNECSVTSPSSSLITIGTGELRISGHQVVIEETEQIQLTTIPQSTTNYSIIAEISVDDAGTPTFRMFIQPQNAGLTENNLFTSVNGSGIYQIRLANFTQSSSGTISSLERVADLISGITKEQIENAIDVASNALSQSNTALSNSSTAISTANTALSNSQSAITGSNNANTTANTALTQSSTALNTANDALNRVVDGLGTKVSVGGTTQSTINFASDPQTQINSTNSQVSANTGNISNLSTNKADKTLSNVTYPQVVADGLARIGVCDRIVERWVASNGLTWYEKYESGWKRCGGIYTIAEDGRDETLRLPNITFSNTNYFCRATALYATLKDNYDRGAFGSHPVSEDTISISSSRVANTGTYAFKCYWTAEGY